MADYRFQFSDSGAADFEEDRSFDDLDSACKEATRELSFLVASRLPDGESRDFAVVVRGGGGDVLFTAKLFYEARHGAAE